MKRMFLLVAAALLAGGTCSRADPTGTWLGTLDAGAARLRVAFNIRCEDGVLSATLDSPDQGARGIPVAGVEFKGGKLTLDVAVVGGNFEGRLEGDRLSGRWRQGGGEFPLELTRVDSVPAAERPQEPAPPYSYDSEDVTFGGPAGTIAGTLTRPAGEGPFTVVLLVSGSGQQNRDEEIYGHKPFLVLADHLTRQGFAVLRCDDRGVGGTTGDPSDATSEDFALDAQAALDWLRARPEVAPGRVGIIGHSEGALIAAMLGARAGGPDFVVLLAGTGVPGGRLLAAQGELLMRVGGATDAAVEANRRLQERLFAVVRRGLAPESLVGVLKRAFEDELAAMSPGVRTELAAELAPAAVAAQVRALASPWFRFFIDHDPARDLRRVKVPVLALTGSKDLQAPAAQNLPAIEAALKAGGNRDHTVTELPGLNHLLQTARTGAVQEYAQIEETIAPAALEAIAGWLARRAVANRRGRQSPAN
ncbi:MAG: alpha/beta fold hydrolase [bacterium]